jgi:hypothetical protein
VLPLLPGYIASIGGAGASRLRASALFTGVPESFLIDASGHVVYHENGPFTNSSIERALKRITA